MGLFDAGRRQLDAQRVLADLCRRQRFVTSSLEWQTASRLLQQNYTSDAARNSSDACLKRIKYLEVAEPQPVLASFAPGSMPPLRECPAKLAEVQSRYQREMQRYAEREKSRLHELETLKATYPEIQAAEVARWREWRKGCWPKGVVLDREIYELPSVEEQVQHLNANIEYRVNVLDELLHDGLQRQSGVIDTDVANSYRAGDASGIAAYIESVLAAMPLPDFIYKKAKVAYTPDSRQLVVEYELPTVEIVPRAKLYRFVKSRDTVTETTRPVSQVKGLYANAIAQIALLCLASIFNADVEQHIDVVVFNGVVDTLDPRSGQPIRPCLITVRVTRDTFAGLDLTQVEPQACLKYLSASVSRSPTELVPVRPVLEFSMVDSRFIAETDAIGSMDKRPNLLEMKPTDFESLIQNLFTKMGLEARQTRPSRDGGVDCVAYDTRPIFGGKVVIQAKRYKNTVGVSAVRDLFGTLQNEGASKGILVTTSGYGAASFEFAQNKPIELIDGGNLLYLLETYTGITARIEPPDDWRDPVPDAGEAPL
jgi:HJR/Mrr/RecB family endonuclease